MRHSITTVHSHARTHPHVILTMPLGWPYDHPTAAGASVGLPLGVWKAAAAGHLLLHHAT